MAAAERLQRATKQTRTANMKGYLKFGMVAPLIAGHLVPHIAKGAFEARAGTLLSC